MVRSQHYPQSIKLDAISPEDLINFNKVIRAVHNKLKDNIIDVFLVRDGVILKKSSNNDLIIKIYPSGDKELGMVRK